MAEAESRPWVTLRIEEPRGAGAPRLTYRDDQGRRRRLGGPDRWRALTDPGIVEVPVDFDQLFQNQFSATGEEPLAVFLAPSESSSDPARLRHWISDLLTREFPGASFQVIDLAPTPGRSRAPFRLPLTLTTTGSEDFRARILEPVRSLDWLEAPEVKDHGLWIVEAEDFGGLKILASDVLLLPEERFSDALETLSERPTATRPRLLVSLGDSPELSQVQIEGLPAGVSAVQLPVSGEAVRRMTERIFQDLPLDRIARESLPTYEPRIVPLVSTPSGLDSLRMRDAAKRLQREAYRIEPRPDPQELGKILQKIDVTAADARTPARLRDARNLSREVRRAVESAVRLEPDFGSAKKSLVPLAKAGARLAEARRKATRTRKEISKVKHDPQVVAAARERCERCVDMRFERSDPPREWIDPRWSLREGSRYRLRFHVGDAEPGSLFEISPPALDELLGEPPTPKGHELEVAVFALDCQIEGPRAKGLLLPLEGSSEKIHFTVRTPKRTGSARLRVVLYYRNHLLQSFLVRARVDEKETTNSRRQLRARLEYSRSARFTNLEDLGERKLSLGLNRQGGTHSLMVKGDGRAWDFEVSPGILESEGDAFRELLQELALDAEGNWRFATWPESPRSKSPGFNDAVQRLAGFGHRLHDSLFNNADPELEEALYAVEDTADEVIQIVHFASAYAFPWSVVYDFALPDPVTRICPGWSLSDTEEGELQPCEHQSTPDDEVLCVRGFWGVRHRLELLLPASSRKEDAEGRVDRPEKPPVIRLATGLDDQFSDRLLAKLRESLGESLVSPVNATDNLLDLLWSDDRPAAVVLHGHHEPREVHRVERHGIVLGSEPRFFHDGLVTERRKEARQRWTQPRSLVLLMACGAAALALDTVTSLVPALVKAGALGVVGTEIEVTSALAARCAEEVLLELLHGGASLGHATVHFRRKLLAEGNPSDFSSPYTVTPSCRWRRRRARSRGGSAMRKYPGLHIVFSTLLFLSWTVPLLAADEPPKVVSFPYGTQVEISAAGTEDTRWIPVKLADGVDIGDVRPTLRDVKRGDVRAGFEDAFAVQAASGDDSTGPGITVTVSLDPPLEPGTYTLHLEVPAIGETTEVMQALQVVVPDAKVQALGALAVTRVEGLGFWQAREVGNQIRLRETGDRSRLTGASLVQLEATGPGREPVTARLTSGSPLELEAGSSEKIFQLDSEGEFPLGETKGKLELDGPQLDAPVTLQFEYLRRLHRYWLLVPVIFGILLGYMIRIGLVRRAEKLELESQAYAFLVRVAKEKGRSKDSPLHTRLDEIEANVRRHLDNSDKLPDQLTAAQEELKAALEEWAERQATQKGRLNDLNNLLSLAWQIPRSMRDALRARDVQEGLNRAAARLDEKDPKGATDDLDEVETTLKKHLASAADAWRDKLKGKLGELDQPRTLLLTEAATWAASRLTTTRDALVAIPADAPDPEIEALLYKAHEASVDLGNLVEALDLRMRTRLKSLLDTLGSLALPEPEIIEDLARRGQSFFESPEERGPSPDAEARLRRILDEVPEIGELLVEAMVSQVEDGDRKELAKKLRNEKFDEAAQFLREHLKAGAPRRTAPTPGEGAVLGSPSVSARASAISALSAGRAPRASSIVGRVFGRWFGGEILEVGETAEAQRVRTHGEIARIKLMQLFLAGVLILVASYFVFAETYVGTAKQNIGLFFWAFALDLSVEGALSVGNLLRPKTG